eukprot:gene24433-biopygen17918
MNLISSCILGVHEVLGGVWVHVMLLKSANKPGAHCGVLQAYRRTVGHPPAHPPWSSCTVKLTLAPTAGTCTLFTEICLGCTLGRPLPAGHATHTIHGGGDPPTWSRFAGGPRGSQGGWPGGQSKDLSPMSPGNTTFGRV